jgi:hypothetical protein
MKKYSVAVLATTYLLLPSHKAMAQVAINDNCSNATGCISAVNAWNAGGGYGIQAGTQASAGVWGYDTSSETAGSGVLGTSLSGTGVLVHAATSPAGFVVHEDGR